MPSAVGNAPEEQPQQFSFSTFFDSTKGDKLFNEKEMPSSASLRTSRKREEEKDESGVPMWKKIPAFVPYVTPRPPPHPLHRSPRPIHRIRATARVIRPLRRANELIRVDFVGFCRGLGFPPL